MSGWLERIKTLIAPASGLATTTPGQAPKDEMIALGVLLWSVAEADGRLLDAEKAVIGQVLSRRGGLAEADLAVVLATVEQAAAERIDLYSFAREVSGGLSPEARGEIVRQLYRVACADGSLDLDEVETVRLVAGLLHVPHKDFIAAKLAAKAEFAIGARG